MFKKRDYQRTAHERSRELYDAGIHRQLLVMATGTGKTITFAALPEVFPELARHGTLILVHRDELVFQAAEKFRLMNPSLSVGIEKAEYQADLSSDVIVGSVQTLGHPSLGRLHSIMDAIPFGIIVVDEAHHAKPDGQYDRILSQFGMGSNPEDAGRPLPDGRERLLFGVTATPNRNDKVGLSHFFEDIVLDFGIREAVQQGYLTDIEHRIIHTGTDISGVRKQGGDFQINALSDATDIAERNNLIVSAYRKYGEGKSALMFCSSVQHAHNLAAVFRSAGYSAEAIDANTPKDRRREILRDHEARRLDVVTNFGVLTEGYDGVVDLVGMCRPTKSQPLYIQMLGRGLRTIPPDLGNLETLAERKSAISESVKPVAIVLDFVDMGHDVVTAPSLFGINPTFESDGEPLVGVTLKVFNTAIEKNPLNAESILAASTFEEVEVASTRIDVWTMARSHRDLSTVSNFRWIRLGPDALQLDVPLENRRVILRIDQDYLGHWALTVTEPANNARGYWEPAQSRSGGSWASMEQAIRAIDQRVSERFPESRRLIDTSASWRKGSVSEGQRKMLESYGIDPATVPNKGVASDLIAASKASGMSQKRGVFRNA